MRRARVALQSMAVLLLATWLAPASAADLTVSAASSLTNALREVAPLFESAHPGSRVRLNFGASHALLVQIDKGAPVDVLISADRETMDAAQSRGVVQAAQRRNVAGNTLVVVVPVSRPHLPGTLADLARVDVEYGRIAIGLPAVPAGRYARNALDAAGLWPALERKVVGAQTVRQALDYVARGEADAGFVYATDAALMSGKVKVAFTVPTTTPIVYPAAPVVASRQPAQSLAFVEFLLTAPAQAVLARHGFVKR